MDSKAYSSVILDACFLNKSYIYKESYIYNKKIITITYYTTF